MMIWWILEVRRCGICCGRTEVRRRGWRRNAAAWRRCLKCMSERRAAYGSRGICGSTLQGRGRLEVLPDPHPALRATFPQGKACVAAAGSGRTEASAPTGCGVGDRIVMHPQDDGTAYASCFWKFSFFSSPGAAVLFFLQRERKEWGRKVSQGCI